MSESELQVVGFYVEGKGAALDVALTFLALGQVQVEQLDVQVLLILGELEI